MTKDEIKEKYHDLLNQINELTADLNDLTLKDDFKKHYPDVDKSLSESDNPLSKLYDAIDELDDLL
ncbi:MAG: hypothetical protein J6S85_22735 [Methanobrevibacter sp.]|nr:hypothetical protein [Methanobrevibacter sp.]